jgi:hypothetical protein
MGAYESWVYTLRCPQCARTGAAKEVELDGWSCQAGSVLLGYAIQRLHLFRAER